MSVSLQYFPKLAQERLKRHKTKIDLWPDKYINSSTGKEYQPQNEQVDIFVNDDTPRYMLLKGGEGGGKSSAGSIKTLNKLRRGISGIMVGPDLEHFKKSLWSEFKQWIPWQCVIERHRYRQMEGWEPTKAFTLVFHNEVGGYSELTCGGCKEDQIHSWRGPNVGFACLDEISVHRKAGAIKVFDGRVRIPGPNNEPSQLFLMTTPEKHWLFDLFAGAKGDENSLSDVPEKTRNEWSGFRNNAYVGTVLTKENEEAGNLEQGFAVSRSQTLTEAESRVYLQAMWEDVSDVEKFVNIIWWNNCQAQLPGLSRNETLVLGVDAATGSENQGYLADCFALLGVTRHPDNKQNVAVRYCGVWEPQPGQLLDFEPIEQELIRLCKEFATLEITYDPTQLHYLASRLKKKQITNIKPFTQGLDRLKSDKQLQDLIMSRRLTHDGNPLLKQHIDNANIKKAGEDGIRLVKRSNSLKIDAAVALSMAASRCLYYNLG